MTIISAKAAEGGSKKKTHEEPVELVGDVNASGGWTYDYSQNGADFGSLVSSNNAVNYCGNKLN